MLPASALPVIVGVVSLVVVDVVVIDGELGAVVSIVINNSEEAEDVLLAASVAVQTGTCQHLLRLQSR